MIEPKWTCNNRVISLVDRWAIASWQGHVTPLMPYISDLGVVQPEQSFFTLSMSVGATLILCFVLARWWLSRVQLRHTAHHAARRQSSVSSSKSLASTNEVSIQTRVKRANRSLVTGLTICIGFFGVSSFANTNPPIIHATHNIFASIGFLAVLVDMCFEWRTAVALGRSGIARLRCLIWILATISAIIYTGAAIASYQANLDAYPVTEKRLRWSSGEPGYELHVISAAFELVLVWMLCPYMLSYRSLFATAKPRQASRGSISVAVVA